MSIQIHKLKNKKENKDKNVIFIEYFKKIPFFKIFTRLKFKILTFIFKQYVLISFIRLMDVIFNAEIWFICKCLIVILTIFFIFYCIKKIHFYSSIII